MRGSLLAKTTLSPAWTPGCASAPAVHVDLLLRSLAVSDTRPACVVVRVFDRPRFWLRLIGRRGPVDLD